MRTYAVLAGQSTRNDIGRKPQGRGDGT